MSDHMPDRLRVQVAFALLLGVEGVQEYIAPCFYAPQALPVIPDGPQQWRSTMIYPDEVWRLLN